MEECRAAARRRLMELVPEDHDICSATCAVDQSATDAMRRACAVDAYRYLWDQEAAVMTASGLTEDLRPCFFCGGDDHQ